MELVDVRSETEILQRQYSKLLLESDYSKRASRAEMELAWKQYRLLREMGQECLEYRVRE